MKQAYAAFQGRGVQWTVPELAYATVGLGALTLTTAAALTVRAAAFHPSGGGVAGDLASDLGVPIAPWRLAVAHRPNGLAHAALPRFGLAHAEQHLGLGVDVHQLAVEVAGFLQTDPIDGLARAFGDALLCLAGFAFLGRPLGLRR